MAGFEPATLVLTAPCSTAELHPMKLGSSLRMSRLTLTFAPVPALARIGLSGFSPGQESPKGATEVTSVVLALRLLVPPPSQPSYLKAQGHPPSDPLFQECQARGRWGNLGGIS